MWLIQLTKCVSYVLSGKPGRSSNPSKKGDAVRAKTLQGVKPKPGNAGNSKDEGLSAGPLVAKSRDEFPSHQVRPSVW